ncbi:MAG: hypothetical protein M0R18_15590 [Deltaproteobacteria bacterium]|nr:hypothetical protein [Deltaproteobacteria bacterium]
MSKKNKKTYPEVYQDRMARPYDAAITIALKSTKAHCPECDAFPVVCTYRKPGYSAYRCRVCGNRWEEGER